MNSSPTNVPVGIAVVEWLLKKQAGWTFHKFNVLFLTFLSYACFLAARRPSSVVKIVLHPQEIAQDQCENLPSPTANFTDSPVTDGGGWAPFDGDHGESLLGVLDTTFLVTYAVGTLLIGHLGDQVDVKLVLAGGMAGCGVSLLFMGMAYFWNIHSFWYFLVLQVINGLFQTVGWPCAVSIVANWYGKGKRGLVMGIWCAMMTLGNSAGTFLSSWMLDYGWGWSFIVTGVIVIVSAVILRVFLVVRPEDVGLVDWQQGGEIEETSTAPNREGDVEILKDEEVVTVPLLEKTAESEPAHKQFSFIRAMTVPGVVPYAVCLMFNKLVANTLLYWLPFYAANTCIEGRSLGSKTASNLSIMFDMGGVISGVVAGDLADRTGASGLVAFVFCFLAAPSLYFYNEFGGVSLFVNHVLLCISGFFVNGPYSLISSAVAADLGNHSSIHGDARMLATITSIINGMGSIGSAIGPALTGRIIATRQSSTDFSAVFYMLASATLVAGILLLKIVHKEDDFFKLERMQGGRQ